MILFIKLIFRSFYKINKLYIYLKLQLYRRISMAGYNLQPNESIIMKKDRIIHGGAMANFTDELILTNLHIVLISKGMFGNAKGIQVFPLNHIKVFNGQAQVLLGKTRGGYPQIDVYFLNGQESFGFENKKEAVNWIENINKLRNGNEVGVNTSPNMAIPGAEYIAETLKGTVDTFKDVLGIKTKSNNEMPIKAVKKCSSCSAPISGTKGQIVHGQYCDADQQL